MIKVNNATVFTSKDGQTKNYTGLLAMEKATVTNVAVFRDAEGNIFGVFPQNQYFAPTIENGEKKVDANGKPVMTKKFNVAITGSRDELNAKVAELYAAGKVKALPEGEKETSIGVKLGTVTVEDIDVKVSVRVEATKPDENGESKYYMVPPRGTRAPKEGEDPTKTYWWYYVNIPQEDRDALAAEIVANAKAPAPKAE